MKRLPLLHLIVILLFSGAFGVFIWPTPYAYAPIQDQPLMMTCVNRFTRHVWVFTGRQWVDQSKPKPDTAEIAKDRASRLLDAQQINAIHVKIIDSDSLEVGANLNIQVYNGTAETIDAVRVKVVSGDQSFDQGWRDTEVEPYSWGTLRTTISNAETLPSELKGLKTLVSDVKIDSASYRR